VSTTDTFYQHSDNRFYTAITAADGSLAENSDFIKAEYMIGDLEGNVLVQLDLVGGGITTSGANDFLVHVDDTVITFTGSYEHQFVVWDLDGNKLPPVFKRRLKVLPILKEN
jgi:hypothetical protein